MENPKKPHAQYSVSQRANDAKQESPRILRRPEVEARTGLSRSLIYAKLDPKGPYYDAAFPRPVKLGMRAVGWTESAVNAWLENRTEEAA
jgi:prophage regulatory protein